MAVESLRIAGFRLWRVICLYVGLPSPSGATRSIDGEGLQRNQTFGQKFMGNMMDNVFTRSFTSKPKNQTSDITQLHSPSKVSMVLVLLRIYLSSGYWIFKFRSQ